MSVVFRIILIEDIANQVKIHFFALNFLQLNLVKYLYPLGSIYGWGLQLRNRLYNNGILPSKRGPIFTINVGNLALGGTGKTPLTEYLIDIFKSNDVVVAVLSRGYKRKTKGYFQAVLDSSIEDIGDEAFQIHVKFPDIKVFVCENRVEGVERIYGENPEINLVLLDDAFQHRAIRANKNILLTRYNRLYVDDYYIPAGTLRDHKIRANDADIVVVSNSPENLDVKEKNRITGKLMLKNNQKIFFSGIHYQPAKKLFSTELDVNVNKSIVVTGIANPDNFVNYVEESYELIKHYEYPDHYNFTLSDIDRWQKRMSKEESAILITTEKDATRLLSFKEELKNTPIFVISIKNHFYGDEKKLENLLLSWIKK